jgi:hypothetical protein
MFISCFSLIFDPEDVSKLCGLTIHKCILFILAAVKISNPVFAFMYHGDLYILQYYKHCESEKMQILCGNYDIIGCYTSGIYTLKYPMHVPNNLGWENL